MMLFAMALQAATLSQADIDRDAEQFATRAGSANWTKPRKGEALRSTVVSRQWRRVLPAQMRATGYPAPAGYTYRTSARADLDRDGRIDLIELVDNGSRGAIRVSFGNAKKRPVIIAKGDRFGGGQGVFASGPNAIMINYPESRVMFIYMRGDEFRASFVGD